MANTIDQIFAYVCHISDFVLRKASISRLQFPRKIGLGFSHD